MIVLPCGEKVGSTCHRLPPYVPPVPPVPVAILMDFKGVAAKRWLPYKHVSNISRPWPQSDVNRWRTRHGVRVLKTARHIVG
jgi:hypothetical protein